MKAQAPKTIRYDHATFKVVGYSENYSFDIITAMRKVADGVIEVLRAYIWHHNNKVLKCDYRISSVTLTRSEVAEWFNLTDKEVSEE